MTGANSALRVVIALFVGGLVGLLCGYAAGEWALIADPGMSWRRFVALTGGLALVTGLVGYLVALYVVSAP